MVTVGSRLLPRLRSLALSAEPRTHLELNSAEIAEKSCSYFLLSSFSVIEKLGRGSLDFFGGAAVGTEYGHVWH